MANDEGNDNKPRGRDADPHPGFGGILDGVANMLGRLSDLAEKGEALRREVNLETKDGKDVRASYGFSINLASDGRPSTRPASRPTQVKPHKPAAPAAKPEPEQLVREPRIDLFEESDHVLIIAEMPGVPAEQVELQFQSKQLRIGGTAARLQFQGTIDLPCECSPEDVTVTANNGVVEVRLNRPNTA